MLVDFSIPSTRIIKNRRRNKILEHSDVKLMAKLQFSFTQRRMSRKESNYYMTIMKLKICTPLMILFELKIMFVIVIIGLI